MLDQLAAKHATLIASYELQWQLVRQSAATVHDWLQRFASRVISSHDLTLIREVSTSDGFARYARQIFAAEARVARAFADSPPCDFETAAATSCCVRALRDLADALEIHRSPHAPFRFFTTAVSPLVQAVAENQQTNFVKCLRAVIELAEVAAAEFRRRGGVAGIISSSAARAFLLEDVDALAMRPAAITLYWSTRMAEEGHLFASFTYLASERCR